MASSMQIGAMGMSVYEEMLSVVGNNLANAETTGYKGSQITFSDLFSRTLRTGISPDENAGSTNPVQIGLGVAVASVDKNMAQGSFTSTGKDFDVGVDGEGFFVVSDGTANVFTRDGSFDVDAESFLVDPATGYRVQRIGNAGEDARFQLPGTSSIMIPYNTLLPGTLTQSTDFLGNLSASEYDPTTTILQASDVTYSLTSGGLATATDEFSEVEQLQAFNDGDAIDIAGRTTDGTAVSGTFTYGAANDGTTWQDLLNVITTVLGGAAEASASLQEGKLTVSDADSGYSMMDMGLTCASHSDALPSDFDYLEVGGATAQTTNITIFDSQARSHSLTATFVRQGQDVNVWDLVVNACSDAIQVGDNRIAGITFDENAEDKTALSALLFESSLRPLRSLRFILLEALRRST